MALNVLGVEFFRNNCLVLQTNESGELAQALTVKLVNAVE